MQSDHIKTLSTFAHTLDYECEIETCKGKVSLTSISEASREKLYGSHAWPCHCKECGALYISNVPLPLERTGQGGARRSSYSLEIARRKMLVIKLNNNRLG